MNVSSQKYKFDSKLERPLITHLESKLMVSSNCQSSPKLRIVAVPLQHRLGANEDECIWWLHWHYCSRRAEFRGNNPKLRGKKYLNEQGVKDTVTTMKGKHCSRDTSGWENAAWSRWTTFITLALPWVKRYLLESLITAIAYVGLRLKHVNRWWHEREDNNLEQYGYKQGCKTSSRHHGV